MKWYADGDVVHKCRDYAETDDRGDVRRSVHDVGTGQVCVNGSSSVCGNPGIGGERRLNLSEVCT